MTTIPQIDEKVIRVISENLHVYGKVTAHYRGDNGRLLVEFLTPEGFKFMSDPSHLEIVNVTPKTEEISTQRALQASGN